MKLMQKYGAAAAALASVMLFSACAEGVDIGAARAEVCVNTPTCVVVEVTAGDEEKSLYDALAVFAERGELTMDGSWSQYGFYLTSLNGTDADEGKQLYWMVYTSLEERDGVAYSDPSYGTWEYEGKQLFGASYGVSGLPLVAGEWYALVYQSL